QSKRDLIRWNFGARGSRRCEKVEFWSAGVLEHWRKALRGITPSLQYSNTPFFMRIGSLFPYKKARIEIIPLIDIMFFLLASFMLASLSMLRLQSVKMDLPTAMTARRDFKPDIVNI